MDIFIVPMFGVLALYSLASLRCWCLFFLRAFSLALRGRSRIYRSRHVLVSATAFSFVISGYGATSLKAPKKDDLKVHEKLLEGTSRRISALAVLAVTFAADNPSPPPFTFCLLRLRMSIILYLLLISITSTQSRF